MMRYILVIFLTLFASNLWAEEAGFTGLQLAKPPIDRDNLDSIKRGAKFFAANCMSCHTVSYLRYDKIAKEAGISADKTPKNMVFNGVVPPDLSLETGVRGRNWIYTYLHSFYQDTTRPSGANNLLVPNTAMPNQLAAYQGDQVLVENPMHDLFGQVEWYDLLKLTKQGSMTPAQFDDATADVVNFLSYAEEPFRMEQHRLGYWVLGYLIIMFFMMYALKKAYWQDVKRYKE